MRQLTTLAIFLGGCLILYGVSPRGSIALTQAARARAFLEGRAFVTPHDIKAVALSVLQHRLITTYEAEAEGLTSVDVVGRVERTDYRDLKARMGFGAVATDRLRCAIGLI